MNLQIINKLTIRDFYSLHIEDQSRITLTIVAVCKMHFDSGDSIPVAMRKTNRETKFQQKLVEHIVRASAEITALVKAKSLETRRLRQSNLGTAWSLNAVS